MSDASVASALRSDAPLVVVEAPGGCGKTTQGAEFARDTATSLERGRALILAHTHAACDVFALRTKGCGQRVEICTIDGLICQIASAYHLCLGLPPDVGTWARQSKNGYEQIAAKVSRLLKCSPMIGRSLALRYPVVICDEHQDTTADQHSICLAFHRGGARLRIFADPLQQIFRTDKKGDAGGANQWNDLKTSADIFDELDEPHRWKKGCLPLGEWVLSARTALRDGKPIQLNRARPSGLTVIEAENESLDPRRYQLNKDHAKQLGKLARAKEKLFVLSSQTDTVDSLNAIFFRSIPIWEGHTRDALADLVDSMVRVSGDAVGIAAATVAFLQSVATGFSASGFGDRLEAEVSSKCAKMTRGKPRKLQDLARSILDEPNHVGVSAFLVQLDELRKSDADFSEIKIDYRNEFWDAVRLGKFDSAAEGFAELSRRRTAWRPAPPAKIISTIHKAKGLESDHVILAACDSKHFPDSQAGRCRLYVGISRAMHSLTLVVSRSKPSPLLIL